MQEIGVAESISDDKFATRTNAFTAHAQTLLSCLKHTALDRLRVRLDVILLIDKSPCPRNCARCDRRYSGPFHWWQIRWRWITVNPRKVSFSQLCNIII